MARILSQLESVLAEKKFPKKWELLCACGVELFTRAWG